MHTHSLWNGNWEHSLSFPCCIFVVHLQAIVNRFAPPSKRGAVNGTAQSLASGVRALGPFLGGLMWAVFSGLPGPGSQLIPFFIISLTAAGTIIIYYFLPAI